MEVKKILKFSVLLVILFSLSNCKKNKTDVLYDRRYINEIKAARKEAAFYLARNFAPGGTFAVAKDGKIIYSEGLGRASEDLEVPVTRNTKFRIGQVSELFTNLIYHKMVENGTLHPDSTVRHYYPDFPEKRFELPIHHLANHTSGIREPVDDERDWRGLNVTLKAGIDRFKADSLEFPPGMYLVPNMHNYNLLGAIMEDVTGKNFHTILEDYVTDTLNLENTVIDNPFTYIKGRTNFYDHNYIAQVVHATTRDMRFRAPSEGMLSNAEDLVKFGNAVLYSDYFSEEIKAHLFEPILLYDDILSTMANGWILMEDREGRQIYGRSGTVTGGGAALLIYPDEKLVVACAINLGSYSDDYPVFPIARQFLSKTEEQTSEANATEPEAPDEK